MVGRYRQKVYREIRTPDVLMANSESPQEAYLKAFAALHNAIL